MKKHVVTAASVLAGLSMMSGTAFAQTGSVGANFARVETDLGDGEAYGIDGESIYETGGGWSAIVSADLTDSDGGDAVVSLEGHLINRGSNNAWGGFVGLADGDGSTVVSVGAEYAQFFDTSTLAFNANWGTDDDNNVDAYGVNGAYRIFASDNLRFDIGGSLGRAETAGFEFDVNTLGVGVEYRFDASPFSVGAAYTRVDSDLGEADVIGVTARWNFGDTTLKAADRSGATFTDLGSALQSF